MSKGKIIANILCVRWYLDSGCSRHIIGKRSMFLDLKIVKGGAVGFGGMSKGKIIGVGKSGISFLVSTNNVLYVEGLKYNLLSISQFCNSGYIVSFNKDQCIVKIEEGKSFFTAKQHNNLYEIDLIDLGKKNETCLNSREAERWIWHKKFRQVNLKHISKLSKKHLVKGPAKICWKTHLLGEACHQGKQIKTSFKSKEVVSTTNLLLLLRVDLFEPTQTLSLGGKKCGFVIVNDYSRYT